jgi:hypothetical protein
MCLFIRASRALVRQVSKFQNSTKTSFVHPSSWNGPHRRPRQVHAIVSPRITNMARRTSCRHCTALSVAVSIAVGVVVLSSSINYLPVAFLLADAALIHRGGGTTAVAATKKENTTRQRALGRHSFLGGTKNIFRAAPKPAVVVSRRAINVKEPTQLERYQARWFGLPEPLRFFVSGNCGNVCLFLCDWGVSLLSTAAAAATATTSSLYPPTGNDGSRSMNPTVAFFLAYLLHIPAQHALHAALVYGWNSIARSRRLYWTTLLETYSALGVSAVGSAALNGYLRHHWALPRLAAFLLTMALFSVVNFTLMHFIMGTTKHDDNGDHHHSAKQKHSSSSVMAKKSK